MKEQIYNTIPQGDYDLIIVTDTGCIDMIGEPYTTRRELFASTCVINIDHHGSDFGDICWATSGNEHTACTMMIAEIFSAMGEEMTSDIAEHLLLGIYYDTDCFRNANTTPHALKF